MSKSQPINSDGSFTPGWITEAMLGSGVPFFSVKNYLARALTLHDCLMDAASAGLPVYIDGNLPLCDDLTLTAPIIAAGGVITLDGNTITGEIYGPPIRLFDGSVSGSKIVQTAGAPVEFGWLVTGLDETTDVLNELNAAKGYGHQTIQLGARSIRAGDTWVLDVPVTVLTAGFDTIFTRGTTSTNSKPQITVSASNVTLGSLAFTGNIANDTGEFNHCINVVPDSSTVSNITIGDVTGTNIRGDLVYIGGTSTYAVTSLRVGNAIGSNIYRNGVSVTGGVSIHVGDVTVGACGNAAVDVEPNTGSQATDDLHFGRISGSKVVVTTGDPEYPNTYVHFQEIDVDASSMSNSTPPYAGSLSQYGYLQSHTQDVRIDRAYISNFRDGNVISSTSAGNLSIGCLIASGIGAAGGNPSIAAQAFASLTVESGNIDVPSDGYIAILADQGSVNLSDFFTNGSCLFGVNSVWRNVAFSYLVTPANDSVYDFDGLDAIGVTFNCAATTSRHLFSNCHNVRHLNCSVVSNGNFSDSYCSNFSGGCAAYPTMATSPGLRGQWAINSSYRFDCVADNTWQRSCSTTWTGP